MKDLLLLFQLFFFLPTVFLQTTDSGCNCVDCKEILTGVYNGSYQLSTDTDQQARCSSGCFYTNIADGTELCLCDPGDVEYVQADCAGTTTADDAYVTAAKALIDAGTCDAVSPNSNCGTDATSYYKEFEYNGMRVVLSSGVPDHDAESDQLVSNPNERCERWQYMEVPIDPAKRSNGVDAGLAVIGLAVTGGQFFNHLSNSDGSLALANEGPTLDSCFGHSAAAGNYHYHANINCTDAGAATGANDPDECVLIGYYRDGVPVYGLCKDSSGDQMTSCYSLKSGSTTSDVVTVGGTYTVADNESDYEFDSSISGCNLDEGNGAVHPTTGQYSYFMTTGYPWVPIYYYGEDGKSKLCSLDL